MEAVGCTLDQREEALASRRNVRAVLNVVRRPETLRSGVVPLVEKRFESLQHEGLIFFLDCLRHFILLRSHPCPTPDELTPVGKLSLCAGSHIIGSPIPAVVKGTFDATDTRNAGKHALDLHLEIRQRMTQR